MNYPNPCGEDSMELSETPRGLGAPHVRVHHVVGKTRDFAGSALG